MRWRRSSPAAGVLAALAVLALGASAPQRAEANPVCDAVGGAGKTVTGGVDAVTGGAIGGGNPIGDACDAVTGDVVGAAARPVTDALNGVRDRVFEEIATWVADGAGWLMGRVVNAIDTSTRPDLTAAGFTRSYSKMARIAVVLAAAMLLLAVLEGLAQGSLATLGRVAFLGVPLAFIGTSVAFVVVQLLVGATDGLSEAVSSSTGNDGARFFGDAIESLREAGGSADQATGGAGKGSVAIPLFVTFLAAGIAAFAAFAVWLELLMRDAAVYAVALFVPMSLAASIWPRWSGALRRTAELLVVIISSKFVIVAVISLAASLLAEGAGRVEQILAAAALMLLASFAPFVLLRLAPFAEGAMAAAYSRRSASGGAGGAMHMVTQVQMMRNMARSNWGGSSAGGTGPTPGGAGGGGAAGPSGGGGPRGAPGGGDFPGGGATRSAGAASARQGAQAAGTGGASQGAAAGAAGAAPAVAAATAPVSAARGAGAASKRLAQGTSAQPEGGSTPGREQGQEGAAGAKPPRPAQGRGSGRGAPRQGDRSAPNQASQPAPRQGSRPEPKPPSGGEAGAGDREPPRPAADPATTKGKADRDG